jgi:hypothetical protein
MPLRRSVDAEGGGERRKGGRDVRQRGIEREKICTLFCAAERWLTTAAFNTPENDDPNPRADLGQHRARNPIR